MSTCDDRTGQDRTENKTVSEQSKNDSEGGGRGKGVSIPPVKPDNSYTGNRLDRYICSHEQSGASTG